MLRNLLQKLDFAKGESNMTSPKGLFVLGIAGCLLALLLIPVQIMAANQWESLGPYGGDRFDLRISPQDNQTLFVYGFRGIHKSVDGGASWRSVFTPEMMKGNSVIALDFDSLNFSHVYIGGSSQGIWRSYDNGETWTACNSGIPERSTNLYVPISSLAFDSGGILYAGISENGVVLDPPPAWIYSSNNAGDSWVDADSGIVVSAPVLYQKVSVLLSRDAAGQMWAMVYGGGVFRLEGGVWVSHNGNLPTSALRATHLAHHPTDAGHLYLGTEDSWTYETTNGGATWTAMTLPGELSGLSVLPLIYFIGIDPNNASLINIRANDSVGSIEQPLFRPRPEQNQGSGLYTSFNGGAQWTKQSITLFRKVFDPSDITTGNIPGIGTVTRSTTSYVITGGYRSVNKSTDGQMNYDTITNGVNCVLMNTVWVHPNPPPGYEEIIYSGAESGIYLTSRQTAPAWKRQTPVDGLLYTWSFAEDFRDQSQVFYSTGNPAWSYAAQRGIYSTSVDCLNNPESECAPGTQLLADVGVWKVVTTPANPLKIYAACQEDGVMFSSNGGQTWNTLNAGLTLPISITDIILDGSGRPLYAASRTSNGDTSFDYEKNWGANQDEAGAIYAFNQQTQQWAQLPLVDAAVMALDFDATNNVLYAASVQGVLRSDNDGATWSQFAPWLIFTDVVIDPTQVDTLYASSFAGLYQSFDRGLNWVLKDESLRNLEINQLAIDSTTGTLYAATNGESVYRLSSDPQPRVGLTVAALDFGSIPVGFTKQMTFAITNTGDMDLVVQSVACGNAAFSILESFPQTIRPWKTATVSVVFSPLAAGPVNANLVVSGNDPVQPTTALPLSGAGTTPVPLVADMKVNGSNGPLTVNYGTTVKPSITMTAGDYVGQPAEYWVYVHTPFGTYWFVLGRGWVLSSAPLVCKSNLITNISPAMNLGSVRLPKGSYTFGFGVDTTVDGIYGPAWGDMADLTVR